MLANVDMMMIPFMHRPAFFDVILLSYHVYIECNLLFLPPSLIAERVRLMAA